MLVQAREFSGEADLAAMAALATEFREGHLHWVDLPYRFSSWALDDRLNARLWFKPDGRLAGWAMLQPPFWTIDIVCDPALESQLYRQMLGWAEQRSRQSLESPSGRPCWFVNVFASQVGRIRDLEEAGFASQADVGENSWSKVLMRRPGSLPVAATNLPSGFTLRPLAGESEVEAYVALQRAVFESRNMTVEWRRRTLQPAEYVADIDLVAVAPDGRLAAFCVGWLKQQGLDVSGQIEPLGVLAEFRQVGLGSAILSEALGRMGQHGAGQVFVETDNYRDAAFSLSESIGFQVIQEVLVFRKDYASQAG